MHRIDGPTRSATLPAPSAAGTGTSSPGYFQHGDPIAGTLPTTLDVDWANAVQEELAAVVEHFGGPLDKTNNHQLLDALLAHFVTSTAPSFTVNSDGSTWYRAGADGFVEQGGVASLGRTSEGQLTLAFPSAFPSACLGVSCVPISSGGYSGDTTLQEVSLATDHALLNAQSDNSSFSDTTSFRWRAWGK